MNPCSADDLVITGDTVLHVTAGKDGLHAENDEDDTLFGARSRAGRKWP